MSRFTSDTLSTHYIHQPGTARLKRWGLLDDVIKSNCAPVRNLTVDIGPFSLEGSAPPIDGMDASYAPRRTILDEILVNAASAAGVEFRERHAVQEILDEGRRDFFGALTGTVPIPQFFAPENIGGIMRRAGMMPQSMAR